MYGHVKWVKPGGCCPVVTSLASSGSWSWSGAVLHVFLVITGQKRIPVAYDVCGSAKLARRQEVSEAAIRLAFSGIISLAHLSMFTLNCRPLPLHN